MLKSINMSRPSFAVIAASAAVVSLALFPAPVRSESVVSPGAKKLYASRGETTWMRHCIVCHGVDGKGQTEWAQSVTPPPKDLTDPLNVTWAFREDWLRRRIGEGIPGTAMPGWEGVLSAPELTAVTGHVRKLSGADRMTEDQAKAARLERGKRLYAQRCSVCHGITGEADTKIGKAVDPPPRNLADPAFASKFSRDRIERVVRDGKAGTVMPSWKRVLDDQEIRAVAAFVRKEIQKKDD